MCVVGECYLVCVFVVVDDFECVFVGMYGYVECFDFCVQYLVVVVVDLYGYQVWCEFDDVCVEFYVV